MRKRGSDEVFRITGARQGLADDVRGRQRRYVISMSVRTVAVIAAASLWNVERHVAIVALVLGAVLPYVAVVIANAGRETAPPQPRAFVPPATGNPMLTPGRPADEEGTRAHADPAAEPAAEPVAQPGTEDRPGGGKPRRDREFEQG
ncbi:DUF3099 domain-containing protein [Streptomyces sp. NPDC016309]|uniref:DUF3099 domain-containing protein n=1 Tax=Streptomyces sp. NPDC016309 TaxID=3364965 RepID=UPI0037006830